MSVLKTSLLMCLEHTMEEKGWHPVTRLPSPTLWFKNFTLPFLSLGSGSINYKSWRNLPSIPHSLKHGPHSPPHTGSTCCIFLSWPHHDVRFLYDGSSVEGREGREEHQSRRSWVSHKGFPGLPFLIPSGFLERKNDIKHMQTHC